MADEDLAKPEPISLMKMIKGPFTGVYWIKSLMLGLGIFVILIIGYAVYKAYFKRPAPSQTQQINAQDGSQVKVENHYYNDRKKTLIPFVEGTYGKGSQVGADFGIRAGVRFEW